jgi:murein L,D-transpeptidase YcbB/YkuD
VFAFLVIVFTLSGAPPTGSGRPPFLAIPTAEQVSPGQAAANVAAAIRSCLLGFSDTASDRAARRESVELTRLYTASAYAPLWVDSTDRPTRQAEDALEVLADAGADGLDPTAYATADLARRRSFLRGAASPGIREVAAFDLMLSGAMLRYFRHLHLGRVEPATLGYRLTVPADTHDFVALVRAAVAGNRVRETAAELAPPLAQYRGLRTVLARYRVLATRDDADRMPSLAILRPGDRRAGLSALHRRLVTVGDLDGRVPGPSDPEVFDGAIVDAVKRFQMRHGLEADGIVGVRTEAALRVPVRIRVRQIELALERLRWLPDVGDRRLIVMNIPMFQLWAWDAIPPDGRPAFGMRAIVGRARHTQTPILAQDMCHVIFRPYWNIPTSIVRNEILPLLNRQPDYLTRHQMEMVRGAGDAATPVPDTVENRTLLGHGGLRLRQRPGLHNALGLVKFVFPNDADVYMHGTPAQELFGRDRRDFSHGCVRVEDPVALATWVLQSEPLWDRERVLHAMTGPASQRVNLSSPIQVILFYGTAVFMPDTGAVHFAEDIYQHDLRLDRALATP